MMLHTLRDRGPSGPDHALEIRQEDQVAAWELILSAISVKIHFRG